MRKCKYLWAKVLILACLLVFSAGCISCGEPETPEVVPRDYDAAQVEAAARQLLADSRWLCDIYYGAGMPLCEAEDAYAIGRYHQVDDAYLTEHGITSLEDVKQKTRKLFSQAQSQLLFSTVLSHVSDGDVPISMPRYSEQAADAEHPYRMLIDIEAPVYYPDDYVYDLSSVRASHAEGERVFFTVTVTVTKSGEGEDAGKTQTRTQTLCLLEEADGWRLDIMPGASYSVYYER